MADYTDNLSLKKWDLTNEEDLNSSFDISGTLNDNWDKVDEAVGTNSTNIATNTTNIATNTTNISTLETSVETNTEDIEALEEKVATNTTNIATNTTNISTLETSVETNTEDIEALEEKVATNTTNIATNATNITALEETTETNSTNISTLKEGVESNTSSISTIETNVATNTTDITELKENVSTNTENIATNATNIETLQSTVGTGFYSMIAKNAGAHNSVYRGEDITDLWYDGTLSEQIAAGTFDDIFIGDYIIGQSSFTKYLVADINYRLYKGDTECTTPHVLLIPEQAFTSQKMNSTNTSAGAYVGSEMYTTNLDYTKEKIIADFESSHILTHRNYLANTLTDDYESNNDWYDSDIELMNELMVYGSNICHNVKNGTNLPDSRTIDTCQLSLFRLNKSKIISCDSTGTSRSSYWLRDVVSSTQFASVNYYGFANYSSASSSLNIRPVFLIY